jgi:SAM-dependent methyltransferase
MQTDEYLKLAEVEDQMWYFRSLHAHVRRELEARLPSKSNVGGVSSPRGQAGGHSSSSGVGAPRLHILDAGCGTGGLILRLRDAHPEWRYAGIDFMPLACELARKRCGPDVDIRVASITELPFPDRSFDAVVSADVVCQVVNPEVAAAEFFRVLRPGGIAIINVPAYMWMWSYHDDSCETKHRYTRPEIDGLLRDAGFERQWTTHWNALPFPVVWAKRKLFRTRRDTSDVKLYPAPIEAAFNGLMAIEHAWLRAQRRWAWGTSVFGVARKPE